VNRLRVRLVLPFALGAAALWAAVSPGCSATVTPATSGDFNSPGGVAIAPARDRDLLIVTSTGSDELKAITICNTPTLPDGGAPSTTCDPNSDFQFLPGPIRVFPGSFPVGNRPVHIAGLTMKTAAGAISGAVLVAGVASLASDGGTAQALPALKLVDTVNMVDAVQKIAEAKKAADIPLDAPPIDVVAVQPALPFVALSDAGPEGKPPADAGTPQPGVAGVAFVLTQALSVGLADAGASLVPTALSRVTVQPLETGPVGQVTGRCALDLIGARLAVVPGSSDKVYVSDATANPVAGGKGDGVLEIDSTPAAMPAPVAGTVPAPCKVLRRFSTVHPVQKLAQNIYSIAVSPAWFASDRRESDGLQRTFPAGAFLLGATADGHLIQWRTDTAQLLPLPPFKPVWQQGSYAEVSGVDKVNEARELPDGTVVPVLEGGVLGAPYPGVTVPRMEPLRAGPTREVSFLQPPDPNHCPAGWPEDKPCALVNVGPAACGRYSAAQDGNLGLVAAAATGDGYVRFIDMERARFVSDSRDAFLSPGDPSYSTCPKPAGTPASVDLTTQSLTLIYSESSSATAPTLDLAPADTNRGIQAGWTTAGVSRSSNWFAKYHGVIPGLERRGGTLSRPVQALGTTLRFEMPNQDLSPWVNAGAGDPTQQMLQVGDVVSFAIFSNADGSPVCSALQTENSAPFGREYEIKAISKSSIDLAPSKTALSGEDAGVAGFDPPLECLASPVGASLQFRTAGSTPWLVMQALEYRGRAATNVRAVFSEPRFDYPLDYTFNPTDLTQLPTPDTNIGLAFTINFPGTDPLAIPPGSYFEIRVASGQLPTQVSDTGSISGFAGPMVTYQSEKIRNGLLFVTMTGANSVLQIDSSLLKALGGVIAYR
jgi:hypothetical protein